MLEELYKRETYGQELALTIEKMGSIAVSIANRWKLGWPEQVQVLLNEGLYLVNLKEQTGKEKDVLADASHLPHLAGHEILEMYGVKMSPPTWEVVVKGGVRFTQGDAIYAFPTFVTKELLSDHFEISSPGTLKDVLSRPLKK